MKKYKYKCVSIWTWSAESVTRTLNEYANDEWELIFVVGCWHYFKKEVN